MSAMNKLKPAGKAIRANATLRNQVEAPISPHLRHCRQILSAGAGVVIACAFYPLQNPLHNLAVASSALTVTGLLLLCVAVAAENDSSIKHLKDNLERLKHEQSELNAAKKLVSTVDVAAEATHDTAVAQLQSELDQLLVRQSRLLAGERQMLQAQEMRKARMLEMAEERRQGLIKMHELELKQVTDAHGQKMVELETELQKLDENQLAELRSELKALQEKALDEFLLGYAIKDSPIIGITAEIWEALARAGISSAFDISEANLKASGFAAPIARTLLAWRAYLYQQADVKKPMILKSSLRKKIKNKYGKPRLKIESEINEIQGRLRREPVEINELYQIAAARLEEIEAGLAGGALAITDEESDLQWHIRAVNQMCQELREKLDELHISKEQSLYARQSESARIDREIARIQQEMEKIVLPSFLDYLALIIGIRRNLLLI